MTHDGQATFTSNVVDAGTFKYQVERGDSDNPPGATDPHNWYLVRL
jgi:outer membrane autotransporter protein